MTNIFFTNDEAARLSEIHHKEKRADPAGRLRQAKSIYLFGAGQNGSMLLVKLLGIGARVAGFLDNNPARWGTTFRNLPVLKPDDPGVPAGAPLVVLAPYDPGACISLNNQCALLGLHSVFWWDAGLGNPPRENAEELEANPDAIAAASIWADAESRATYVSRVRYTATQDLRDMPPITPRQYFIPEMPRRLYRSFVDGGAFDGDTFLEFRREFADDFDNYYAFESDGGTLRKLRSALPDDSRIHVYPFALYNEKTSLSFLGIGHEASGIVADGMPESSRVSADALDNILENKRVSFIKFDIEGAEPEALLGARNIIAGQMPGLAVCVYHRPDHLWRIPLWIKNLVPEYRLYLRNHGYSDTVCYGVPPEKRS